MGWWLLSRWAAGVGGKWYFIDRTSSRSCSDRIDGKNSPTEVRLFARQRVRVCFTGTNNQPNRKSKTPGVARKAEDPPLHSFVDAAALHRWERSSERLAVLFLCQNKHQLLPSPPVISSLCCSGCSCFKLSNILWIFELVCILYLLNGVETIKKMSVKRGLRVCHSPFVSVISSFCTIFLRFFPRNVQHMSLWLQEEVQPVLLIFFLSVFSRCSYFFLSSFSSFLFSTSKRFYYFSLSYLDNSFFPLPVSVFLSVIINYLVSLNFPSCSLSCPRHMRAARISSRSHKHTLQTDWNINTCTHAQTLESGTHALPKGQAGLFPFHTNTHARGTYQTLSSIGQHTSLQQSGPANVCACASRSIL